MYITKKDLEIRFRQPYLDEQLGDTSDEDVNIIIAQVLEKVASYCRHWYNMETEYMDIPAFNSASPYVIGDRIRDSFNNDKRYLCIKDSPGGVPLTNVLYFTPSDNRNAQIVAISCDLTIFNIHKSATARNVPQIWVDAYDMAMSELKDIQKGKIQLNLPIYVIEEGEENDNVGQRVAYGTTKLTEDYGF